MARAHEAVRAAADVGVTLWELDEVAAGVLAEHGAQPAFLGYHPHFAPTPFPGAICASVNEVIVHGIPDRRELGDGDLISIDIGAVLDGWVGDAARSFVVGTADPQDEQLIAHTGAVLQAGIDAAQVGNRLGDIGHAIGTIPISESTLNGNSRVGAPTGSFEVRSARAERRCYAGS